MKTKMTSVKKARSSVEYTSKGFSAKQFLLQMAQKTDLKPHEVNKVVKLLELDYITTADQVKNLNGQ